MKKPVKIGLLGAGTVGSGVLQVLRENAQEVELKAGTSVAIKTVLVRNPQKKRPFLDGLFVTDKIEDVLEDPEIDIVVELMGGLHPAREYMLAAMESRKHVVTANKDVIAQFGPDLFSVAKKNGVEILFEASVGGGIPIIRPIMESLTANRITEVMGIVNGTTNYMLTKMTEMGTDYQTALREAQEKGYAEANPAADVEGMDALREMADLTAAKLTNGVVVLCAEADGKVNIVAKASKEAVAKGVHAGNLIKEAAKAVGGGGGGRPEMAQAGGKEPEKIPQAMEAAHKAIKAQLGLE